MALKPMLGDVELEMVDVIDADQSRPSATHAVPGLEGDFVQPLGRRATEIALTGVLAGETVQAELKTLRDKFLAAQPVAFASDIATATRVDQVLIAEMGVRELAGHTDLFQYAFTLREFVPPPPAATEPPPIIPPPVVPPEVGNLEVEVVVEGRADFDFSTVTVRLTGATATGEELNRTLANRIGNLWTENGFPPGSYTARATVVGPPPLDGSEPAVVKPGALTHVTITLRAQDTSVVAQVFVVHFHFDNSFVEPCMRAVLEQVAAHAKDHADEHLVVVGHTDLTGSDSYNQSLSERRARAVSAFLTSGADPGRARSEWAELRQARPSGVTKSLHDTWARRQVQWILFDLGRYHGNIDTESPSAADAALTDEAVRRFQDDNGLAVDGVVGDDTWAALIDAYLGRNPLSIDTNRFVPNASGSCDSGPLRWLGCGEVDPVVDLDAAERKNRRVELLFVRADRLPADVAAPETFDLPALGANGQAWCLNPSGTARHACFVRPNVGAGKEQCTEPLAQRWARQPAEPGAVTVGGRIHFEDGSPLADVPFVLIAPDGKILTGEQRSGPLRGWAIPGRTDADGRYTSTEPAGIGVYTMEVRGRVIARAEGAPLEDAKGNVVCARLSDPTSTFNVVVTSLAAASVHPSVNSPRAIVVRKPGSNPRRQPCTLSVDGAFSGSGTFGRSSDAVRVFDAAVGGNELVLDGTDNVFSGAQLLAGVTVFLDGGHASAAVDDVELSLGLTVGGEAGLAAKSKLTVVELTLDVAVSRTAPNVEPPVLAAAVKTAPGRFIQTAMPDHRHERAIVIVRPPAPAGFTGDLVLTAVNGSVRSFADEIPAAGQVPLAAAEVVSVATIPATGLRRFSEGMTLSGVGGDTGFTLGLAGIEPEGDRVAMTVGSLDTVNLATAAAPVATFARVGLWDHAFDAASTVVNGAAAAGNFVGSDSRRFFFRLQDASRAGQAETAIEWRTTRPNGDVPFPPADARLTLTPVAAGSSVFVSQAVMLVTDAVDLAQPTHSGLPAGVTDGGAVKNQGTSNHRLRRVDLRSEVLAAYPHPDTPGVRVNRVTPVFERTPDRRMRLPMHVFVLRVVAGGVGVIATAPGSQIFNRDLRVAEETYARLGIAVDTVVDPRVPAADIAAENVLVTDETVPFSGPSAFTLARGPVAADPRNQVTLRRGGAVSVLRIVEGVSPGPGEVALDRTTGRLVLNAAQNPVPGDRLAATYVSVGHRVVLIDPPPGVNPLAVRFQPTDDEATIAGVLRALPNTVRVIYTGGLPTQNNRGESWPLVDAAALAQVGCSFIDAATYGPYTLAHEVGHLLTNKTVNQHTGHFVQPAAPPGNQLFVAQNLMRAGTTVEGVTQTKRLWDDADADGLNQLTAITGSAFVRPF